MKKHHDSHRRSGKKAKDAAAKAERKMAAALERRNREVQTQPTRLKPGHKTASGHHVPKCIGAQVKRAYRW